MKAGGGKSKGSAFERKICVALSRWVSDDRREDLFWRSAMSGGRATVGKRKGKDLGSHAGDISATHPAGHVLTSYWYVECKTYRDLQLDKFVLEEGGTISKFWSIAVREARQHNRNPMLIAKQNRGEIFVIVSSIDAAHFDWTRRSTLAKVMTPSCSILSFDAMVLEPFNCRMRVRR